MHVSILPFSYIIKAPPLIQLFEIWTPPKTSQKAEGEIALKLLSISQMDELNSPTYIWNKPASEEIGHMLNCHSPIASDELSWLCSWLLTTILFMSLTYAALAVLRAFCKPSCTLDLRTNYSSRSAKSTELPTDFQRTGRKKHYRRLEGYKEKLQCLWNLHD